MEEYVWKAAIFTCSCTCFPRFNKCNTFFNVRAPVPPVSSSSPPFCARTPFISREGKIYVRDCSLRLIYVYVRYKMMEKNRLRRRIGDGMCCGFPAAWMCRYIKGFRAFYIFFSGNQGVPVSNQRYAILLTPVLRRGRSTCTNNTSLYSICMAAVRMIGRWEKKNTLGKVQKFGEKGKIVDTNRGIIRYASVSYTIH